MSVAARKALWDDVPEARRAIMRAIKGKDTKPEIAVRRALHALGYRFQLHRRDLPGEPDIVFPSRMVAVEIRGCFWHGHGCRIGQPARTNEAFWSAKVARNKARDARNRSLLDDAGWTVVDVWECRIRGDLPGVLAGIQEALGPPRTTGRAWLTHPGKPPAGDDRRSFLGSNGRRQPQLQDRATGELV